MGAASRPTSGGGAGHPHRLSRGACVRAGSAPRVDGRRQRRSSWTVVPPTFPGATPTSSTHRAACAAADAAPSCRGDRGDDATHHQPRRRRPSIQPTGARVDHAAANDGRAVGNHPLGARVRAPRSPAPAIIAPSTPPASLTSTRTRPRHLPTPAARHTPQTVVWRAAHRRRQPTTVPPPPADLGGGGGGGQSPRGARGVRPLGAGTTQAAAATAATDAPRSRCRHNLLSHTHARTQCPPSATQRTCDASPPAANCSLPPLHSSHADHSDSRVAAVRGGRLPRPEAAASVMVKTEKKSAAITAVRESTAAALEREGGRVPGCRPGGVGTAPASWQVFPSEHGVNSVADDHPPPLLLPHAPSRKHGQKSRH